LKKIINFPKNALLLQPFIPQIYVVFLINNSTFSLFTYSLGKSQQTPQWKYS